MRFLEATSVGVEYGQIYVMDGTTTWSDPISSIGGQRNGLCGARWPGALVLITGLHTGQVLFTVNVDETAPPIDDSWEDIVEVSYVPGTDEVSLVEMNGNASYPIPLTPGRSYRVRYHASGMDSAQGQFPDENELAGDRYLLSFWPAPPTDDAILKQTSEYAAYWHRTAAEMSAPPTRSRSLRRNDSRRPGLTGRYRSRRCCSGGASVRRPNANGRRSRATSSGWSDWTGG